MDCKQVIGIMEKIRPLFFYWPFLLLWIAVQVKHGISAYRTRVAMKGWKPGVQIMRKIKLDRNGKHIFRDAHRKGIELSKAYFATWYVCAPIVLMTASYLITIAALGFIEQVVTPLLGRMLAATRIAVEDLRSSMEFPWRFSVYVKPGGGTIKLRIQDLDSLIMGLLWIFVVWGTIGFFTYACVIVPLILAGRGLLRWIEVLVNN